MTWPPPLPAFSSNNFADHFDGSLDSRWTAVTSGTGSVTVTDSYLKCTAPSSSAAFVHHTTKLDKTKSQLWQICWSQQAFNTGAGDTALNMCLLNGASAPAADTGANIIAKSLVRAMFYDLPPGTEEIQYYDSGGTRQRWNPATPAWATGFATARTPTILDDYYVTVLEMDGPGSRWRLMGLCQSFPTAGTFDFDQGWRIFYLTDWVAWSATRSNADIWLVLGTPSNDVGDALETRIEWVRYSEGLPSNQIVDGWVQSVLTAPGSIRHVYSFDGINFLPQDRTTDAIAVGAGGSVDDFSLSAPRACFDGNVTDYLFYTGEDGSNQRVCVASAPHSSPQNGPWTKYGSNPIIPLGSAGADDELRTDRAAVVCDLTDSDSTKRWKMIYAGEKASDNKIRLLYATASTPFGTWTKQGTVVNVGAGGSDDENECSFPVLRRLGDLWEVWYEGRDASGVSHVLRATGSVLSSLTKDGVDYSPAVANAKQALTANLSSAPGRTVTVASTSGYVKDASVVVSQSNAAQGWAFSKIRKIVSGTVLELYHGLTGFTTTPPAAKIWQRDGGTNLSPRIIIQVGTEWWFYLTYWDPWFEQSDDADYSANVQDMYLFKHSGAAATSATPVIEHISNPVAWRGFNNDEGTVENMTLLDPPLFPAAAVSPSAVRYVTHPKPILRTVA